MRCCPSPQRRSGDSSTLVFVSRDSAGSVLKCDSSDIPPSRLLGGLDAQKFGLLESSSLPLIVRRSVVPCNEACADEENVTRLQCRLLPFGNLLELRDWNLVPSYGVAWMSLFHSPGCPVQENASTADTASSIPQSRTLVKSALDVLMTEAVVVYLGSDVCQLTAISVET